MAENVLIQRCPVGVSEDVTAYWEHRLPEIERLLRPIPEDQRRLRFTFECVDNGYLARAVLTLPTGTLIARTDDAPPPPDHRAAVDQVVDRLAAEIRRQKEWVRRDEVDRRRRRRERDAAAANPHLSDLHLNQDRNGFFELLRPHLQHLRSHARRELIIAQIEGHVRPGELEVQDLLDEVLVRAWDRWNERPRNLPLDRWLVRLLHEVLDDRGFTPPDKEGKTRSTPRAKADDKEPVSIYDRVREDDPRYEAEDGDIMEANPDWPYAGQNEWAVENNPYWPFVDPLRRDEALPDEKTPEPWQELANDEVRRLILDELSKLPRDQRRAFTLYALEGWTPDQIADLQGRSPDEVRADIESARAALRQRLESAAAV